MIRSRILLSLLLVWSLPALAQKKTKPPVSDEPAVSTSPGESPAAKPAAAPTIAGPGSRPDNNGTTIIGERESPIGLYITPWRNAAPESDIDRPARLLTVQMEALDRRVFARQVEYYEALTNAQKSKAAAVAAPAAEAPKP